MRMLYIIFQVLLTVEQVFVFHVTVRLKEKVTWKIEDQPPTVIHMRWPKQSLELSA